MTGKKGAKKGSGVYVGRVNPLDVRIEDGKLLTLFPFTNLL